MIEENIALAPMTTLRIGGNARFFIRAQSVEDLQKAFVFARENNVPYFILGGGSNTLVSDEGVLGLVIKIENKGFEVVDKDGYTQVTVGAGEIWDSVVGEVVALGLSGLENLSFIPGTVGGAITQNIGAYGVEVGDCVDWVEALNTETMTIEKFLEKECSFGYRESLFKKKSTLVVIRVALNLARSKSPRIEYEEIKRYLQDKENFTPTLLDVRNAIISIRTAKLPAIHLGTAGSFFKNPVITKEKYGALRTAYPDLPGFALTDGNIKVPLAWILDHTCGLRGYREGAVGLYEGQPLAIVNYGGATAEEIRTFADTVARAVEEKTGILPEYEVSLVGDWEL